MNITEGMMNPANHNTTRHFSHFCCYTNTASKDSFYSSLPPSKASPPVPCLHMAGQAWKHMVPVSTVHKAGL